MRGLTGKIQFNQHGLRTGFQLDIVELKKEGLTKVEEENVEEALKEEEDAKGGDEAEGDAEEEDVEVGLKRESDRH